MSVNFKEIWSETWKQGIVVGASALGLSWVLAKLAVKPIEITMSTIDVRTQIMNQGLMTGFGQRFVDFMSNIIPLIKTPAGFIGTLIAVILGAYFILYTGKVVHKFFNEFSIFGFGKSKITKLPLQMLIGAALLGILLKVLTSIDAWTIIVALLIYYLVLSIIVGLLSKMGVLKFFKAE